MLARDGAARQKETSGLQAWAVGTSFLRWNGDEAGEPQI
jgi:hypothetical protein